ncbi:uncharacterized protein EI97DRAFT_462889 [Westerdykella ornata]|uniref:Uncharacterized protein n=1 Tax=Westerdykella ornata TaxID=318751 RepID=A0A6A6J5C7_WESOR|nr:uncharacterized protein EI97DRAFT_462889 [Westerdykella ornata]KAF2271397.1 hypothetical protein EI97DRAFT_462889 [Westerdykella ornata]
MSDVTGEPQVDNSSECSSKFGKITFGNTMDVDGDIYNLYRVTVTLPAGHPSQIIDNLDKEPAYDDAVSRHRLAALVNLNMTRDEYDSRTGPLTAHDIGVALGDSEFTVEWAMNYLLGLGYRDFSLEGIRNCLNQNQPMVAVAGRYQQPPEGYEGTAGERGIYTGLRNGKEIELYPRLWDADDEPRHRNRSDGLRVWYPPPWHVYDRGSP